ncbi:MAG: ABC transporter ATP-binding protein/permease [Lachnospiraceae bacterium]|nr:ABC transporter ATP-binding protein/permease [Lachnospiraceae bacterium]
MEKKTKLQWLRSNLDGNGWLYILSLFGVAVYSIMQLTVPFVSREIVDVFLTSDDAAANMANRRDYFFFLIFAMVGLTLLRTTIVYLSAMGCEKVSQGALYKIRTYLFNKIEHQDMNFFNTYRTGDLMTRLTGDLDAIRHMIAWVLKSCIESIFLVGATSIYFFIMDWRLALAILALAPVMLWIIILFKNKVKLRHRDLREKFANLNTDAQENISGNRVVKAFAREDYEIEKFDKANVEYSTYSKKTAMTWLEYFPYVQIVAELMPIVLLVFGGILIINKQMTPGEFVAFSGLCWAIANPMRNMGGIVNEFQRFNAAAAKVMEIYYSEPKIVDKENAIELKERVQGKIEFKNVSFKYEDGKLPVLNDVSFTVNPGETVAIMGETGCGKTSLINLIPRFYEPTSGEVLIDGINVSDIKLHDLRCSIGLASQDVLLYSDSIDGNIAYGNLRLSLEEVMKYAKYSQAAEFIQKMPERYDTIIGERGVGLSGGQKQRISLARALAVAPPILILDDTTSAVDMETEKEIQHALKSLDFECTKLIIAQRISTTKACDKILVLKDGRIVEEGSHDELVAKGGYYCSLVKLQTGEEVVA